MADEWSTLSELGERPQSSVDWLRQHLPALVGDYLAAREAQAMRPTSGRQIAGDVISTAMGVMPAGRAAPNQRPIFSNESYGHGDRFQWFRPKQVPRPDNPDLAVDKFGLMVMPDRTNGVARVSTAKLPEELRGQGIGTAMYEAAHDWAKNNGMPRLVSDSRVSTDAARVYESLANKGYDVRKNPLAELNKRGTHWVFPDTLPAEGHPTWIFSVGEILRKYGLLAPAAGAALDQATQQQQ